MKTQMRNLEQRLESMRKIPQHTLTKQINTKQKKLITAQTIKITNEAEHKVNKEQIR